MKISNSVFFWICFGMAALFVVGKYFVAENELERLSYGIYSMLWIILGLCGKYLMDIKDKLNSMGEKK